MKARKIGSATIVAKLMVKEEISEDIWLYANINLIQELFKKEIVISTFGVIFDKISTSNYLFTNSLCL